MLPIVFSHANSFPASTYRVLFQHLKARGIEVSAVERYGHDPKYPVTNNWPHLVQQLADFATPQVERLGQPVFLVGHSLGGARAVETAIYNTRPHNLGRLLSTHPLQCPAAFIGGRDSDEMRQVGMAMTLRITQ